MMELVLNDKAEIIEYATIGDLANGQTYSGELPTDFADDFAPGYYLLKDDQITVNPDYTPPAEPEPDDTPAAEQQAITALAQQIADSNTETKSHLTSIEQALTALATGGDA